MEFELKEKYSRKELSEFAEVMQGISAQIGFKVSSRGWCYILEGYRLINKDQFNKVDTLINNCRRYGYLPIDFVAEESSRQFHGVEEPDSGNVVSMFGNYLRGALNTSEYFVPDWWEGEEYYIQMVVEKIDLVTLFQPVCNEYHIPIANSKGWSSMLQRAEYARRFAEARDKGLKTALCYCGDHDPDGLRISEFIRKNLEDLKDVTWEDGTQGFDPADLEIQRFGLNKDFIDRNNLTWIDNLITGSGKNLASASHKNFRMPYVQHYLKTVGERKCEANAIVTKPDEAANLVRQSIESFLGPDARGRFADKRQAVVDEFDNFLDDEGIRPTVQEVLTKIENYGG